MANNPYPPGKSGNPFTDPAPVGKPTPLDKIEVMEHIPSGGITRDALAQQVDVNEGFLTVVITELDESGEIRLDDDNIYKR